MFKPVTMDAIYPTSNLVLSASLIINIISFFILPTAQAAPSSQLSSGKSLVDGATLISSGGISELGFFSPGSSTNRYVGIWYHRFSATTTLWVANRDSPLLDTLGSLSIASDGNLVILDGHKAVVWSSKVASLPSNESMVELLDTGNLVLNNSDATVWQSFDNPGDTYLPGMKVGLDLVTNVNQVFTSWRSKDDPAPGNFTLGIAPDLSTQFFIWEGGRPRWRSGRWNGQVFLGIQNMVTTYIDGFKLSDFQREKKMYFYYTHFNISHHYILMPDGVDRHLIWDTNTKNWNQLWAQPITQCEIYNRCGNNATCTDSADGNSPTCSCLEGFESDNYGKAKGGCVRRTSLQCETNNGSAAGESDRFYLIKGMKLPDLSYWDLDPTDDAQCKEACLKNCSCKAYSYQAGIGCLTWGRELVDIHMFSSGGNDFYLRLAGSEFDDSNKGIKGYLIAIIVVCTVVMLIGGSVLVWKHKSIMEAFYGRRMKRQESLVNPSRSAEVESSGGLSTVMDMKEQGKDGHDVPRFSFQAVENATTNFSSLNLLGQGGFGPVYKGTMPGGQDIAVKRLSRNSGQGMEEFKNEVILIAKLQHRNLVRLLGYCIRRDDKMLIYEYMANRSLDVLLFDARRKLLLDWKTRYSIIEGIARGLLYLHRDSRLRIIHRDLKVSNILLDENMNPKISDFGMARIFGNDGNETNTKRVVGTYGYMSPEFAMQGLFSVKSDVYSFGVLLIEIVSGMRNSTYYNSELSQNLLGCAWELWNEDNVMELVDSSIRNSCPIREISRCINVGLLCIQDRANDRPTMSSVIMMLESENYAHPSPRRPRFAAEIIQSENNSLIFDKKTVSRNASITIQTGR